MSTADGGSLTVDVYRRHGGEDGAGVVVDNNGDIAKGRCRTVLLLHDFMTDRRLYHRVADHLLTGNPNIDDGGGSATVAAAGMTLIALDMRGFGASSAPVGSYSHTRDMHSVVRAITGRRDDDSDDGGTAGGNAALGAGMDVDVVGCGSGGAWALEYALWRPGAVRSVAVVSTGMPGHKWRAPRTFMNITQAQLAGRLLAACDGDVDAAAAAVDRSMLDAVTWKKRYIESNESWRYSMHEGDATVARGLLGMARDYKGFHFFNEDPLSPPVLDDGVPLIDRLNDVKAPVAVMLGKADSKEFAAIASEVVGRVQKPWRQKVMELDGCSHFAPLERPDLVAESLQCFWNDLDQELIKF